MRTFLRGKALLFLTFGLLLAVPAVALADNFQNTLAASETGTRTITTDGTTAGSTSVGYRVIGTGGDGGPSGPGTGNCNASDGTPLGVSFNVSNVTANPNPLSFNSCGTTQNVTFSSTTPGTYNIDPGLSDTGAGTYTDQSTFTLHVQGTGTSVTDVSGSGTEGESDGSLSAKLVWNNNNVGGKTISFAIDKEKNGTFTTVGSATTDNTTGIATLSDVSLAGLAPGTYDLKATFAADNNYAGDDTTGTLTVNSANTAPELTVPANITGVEATGPNGAPVNFTASATDAEDDPDPTPVCSRTSGSTFPLGTTTVNCSVTDSGGLEDTGSFTVEVVDTTGPALNLPDDITGVEATGPNGASVNFTATANDLVDGSRPVTCTRGNPATSVASGDTFALGTTTVTCSASDTRNNSSQDSFTVTVVDTTAPTISGMPSNISLTATSAAGAVASWTAPTASDLVDGTVPVTCKSASNLVSGNTFPLGTTTVECTATDAAGNKDTKSFTVNVTVGLNGILQPINGGLTLGNHGDDNSSFKAGSTVPVKFQLSGDSAGIQNAVANLRITKVSNGQLSGAEAEAVTTTSASSGSLFRYDATTGQYIYNWGTKGYGNGTYQLRIDFGDGNGSHTVWISLFGAK
jgi:hypothetical protein